MRKPINLLAMLALVFTLGVLSVSAAVKTTTIRVTGMTWGGCASSVEQALKRAPGVIEASVSFEKGEAFIRYDDKLISIAKLHEVINSTGFKAVKEKGSRKPPAKRGKRKTRWWVRIIWKEIWMMSVNALKLSVFLSLLLFGCSSSQTVNQASVAANQPSNAVQELKTTRLHIDGFMKSKSGATWMTWPETVKQALDGLAYVRKVEMVLERDEFLVTYDPAKGNDELLMETVKQSGYTARVVSNQIEKTEKTEETVLPEGFPILDKALAQAKIQNKPLVLDFYAEWCVPCKQMEKDVFPDPKVAVQLKQVVFLRIDTDKDAELTQKLGVVGLPDIRFATPTGKIIHKTIGFQDAESFSGQLEKVIK